jgi:dihydrolipoamide dehydrogenase
VFILNICVHLCFIVFSQEVEMVVGDVTTAIGTLIVGAGPGGYVAAIRASQLGQNVTLVDNGQIGGTCLNSGCIPLKALVSAAERYHEARPAQLKNIGVDASEPSLNFSQMQSWKDTVVLRLNGGVAKLLQGHKVEVVHGKAWFLSPTEMRVEGEYGALRYSFDNCILAVGAEATPLKDLPYDGKKVLTPSQALALTTRPEKITIAGDDYIALELATIFARLGTAVTLLVPEERPLPDFEAAAVRLVQAGFRKLNIKLVTKAKPLGINGDKLLFSNNKVENKADLPVVASNGVKARTVGLNLPAVQLEVGENGELPVNSAMQTAQPHIFGAGDCTGGTPLANIAIKQAKVAAEALSGKRVQYAPQALPVVVHTSPEIAMVGLTAEAATQAGYKVKSGRFALAANGRALTLDQESGTAIVVAEADTGIILGVTVVAPRAGDIIGEATLAIEMGATLTDIAEILHPHPGIAEILLEASESALGQVIHQLELGSRKS